MSFPTVNTLDGRLRVIMGMVFAICMVILHTPVGLAVGGAAAMVCLLLARREWAVFGRRLLALQGFLVVILLVLPFSVPGTTLFEMTCAGLSLVYTREGLLRAGMIWGKATLIFSVCWSLIGTLNPMHLGGVLRDLKVPLKLTTLLFFSVRFVDMLRGEYHRLRRSMRVRGFVMRLNRHSLRHIGYLVGNLLVRSFDRSEVVLSAMRTRGFRGEFHRLDSQRTLSGLDYVFGSGLGCIMVLSFIVDYRLI